MIKITINNTKEDLDFIDPCSMLNSEYGTIFQQWFNGKPMQDFYMSCGYAEKSMVHIWHCSENKCFKLSTDDLKSLKGLAKTVKVVKIDATVEINLLT